MMLVTSLLLAFTPARAHKDEKHGGKASHSIATAPVIHAPAAGHASSAPQPATVGPLEKERPPGFFARLTDWLGRLHPILVHFPMAFLPAALFTAVVGRKRPSFAAPVQFLVVAGGSLAALSAVLGWLNAGFSPAIDAALLAAHRWLGSFIGLIALGLALWAARRPERDRSPVMIVGLSIITAAILAQGWTGGALVHGADHLNW